VIKHIFTLRRAFEPEEGDDANNRQNPEQKTVINHKIADAEHNLGLKRELTFKLFENAGQFGDDGNHNKYKRPDGYQRDNSGINHGTFDFAFDLAVFFYLVGQPLGDLVQDAAFLTGADHIDVHFGESLRVFAHGLG
jgi:hypothetical protein